MSAQYVVLTAEVLQDVVTAEEQQFLFESLIVCNDSDLLGGYLCIADARTGDAFQANLFGCLPSYKARDCILVALDQARLLSGFDNLHSSRHQPDTFQPRVAAIRAKQYIICCAGPNAEFCESFCLLVATWLSALDKEQVLAIATQSGNLLFTDRVIHIFD